MKKIYISFVLLFGNVVFCQEKVNYQDKNILDIYGYVKSNNNYPLFQVHITNLSSKSTSTTNNKGFYKLKARVGDILKFSFIGFETKQIKVDNDTTVLNVDLKEINDMLEEVQIKSNKIKEKHRAYGKIVDGKDLSISTNFIMSLNDHFNFFKVIDDQFEGIKVMLRAPTSINANNYAIWEVDGFVYETFPNFINISDIKDVRVLKSISETTKYGMRGSGGVIIINTKKNISNVDKKKYQNNKRYKDNAQNYLDKHLKELENKVFSPENIQTSYRKLNQEEKKEKINYYLTTADFLFKNFDDKTYTLKLLEDVEKSCGNDVELLKAVAYLYDKNSLFFKSLPVYKKIIELEPNIIQSYRDFANSLYLNEDYLFAWKIYKYYLQKFGKIEDSNTGDILYREMERLYISKKEIIKESLELKKDITYSKKPDIRVVFEWNIEDAQLEMEIVDPQKRSLSYFLQKEGKTTSREFIIDESGNKEWLINVTRYKHKKDVPFLIKMTVFKNWNKSNQKRFVKLFIIDEFDKKINLFNSKR